MNKSQKASNDSVVFYLEKAIESAVPFPSELRSLSFQYFQAGKKEMAKEMFFKCIMKGHQFELDEDFKEKTFVEEYANGFLNLKDSSKFGIFHASMISNNLVKVRKLRKNYLKQISLKDDAVFETLLQNEKYFQELRFLFFEGRVKDSIALRYLGRYGATPNSYLMLDLLRKGNFPKRRKCKRFNELTITMLLNHAVSGFLKKEDASEFLERLWSLVEHGELSPNEYANAYDHFVCHFVDENKSLFGTKMYSETNGHYQLMDLTNPEEINKIREDHWLLDIEWYCESYNITLPKNYER